MKVWERQPGRFVLPRYSGFFPSSGNRTRVLALKEEKGIREHTGVPSIKHPKSCESDSKPIHGSMLLRLHIRLSVIIAYLLLLEGTMSAGQIVSEESQIARQLIAANVVTQSKQPEKMWELTLDDPGAIVVSAWSSTGKCLAVATDTTVHVIDSAGRPLWDWKFQETSRYLHPTGYYRYAFALSPACNAVVMGGGSDYKYIWIADRSGGRSFFKTTGTPFHARFDATGQTIAVTTGAWVGYLLSPRLNVRWSGTIGNLPVKWPGQVVEPAATGWAEFSRDDVEKLLDVNWGDITLAPRDSVSDDGQWRVVWGAPYRGPGIGAMELWGPRADGYRDRFGPNSPGFLEIVGNPRGTEVNSIGGRQPRWSKDIGCPGAEITRDGMFVVGNGDLNHPEYVRGGTDTCDPDGPIYVFDRDGNTVLTWPQNGSQEDTMAEAVFRRTGVRLSLSEHPRWADRVPSTGEQSSGSEEKRTRTTYSPDGEMVLISRGPDLRVYKK
jgi:hypothetical protein